MRSTVLQATVQDHGRPGYAHLGVGTSGAADLQQFAQANRLVGNADSAPAIEFVAIGPPLVFDTHGDMSIAATGAPGPVAVDGRRYWSHEEIWVPCGSRVQVDASTCGMYRYIAIRGGLVAEQTLGSVATDVLSGLGSLPLSPGCEFAVSCRPRLFSPVDLVPPPAWPEIPRLRIIPGPRDDWVESLTPLLSYTYTVSDRSNRIGLRLQGAPLQRRVTDELPSEGISTGALQIPPDGLPILFLADHPVTGGYPVVAVVAEEDLRVAAQLRIGQQLAFAV